MRNTELKESPAPKTDLISENTQTGMTTDEIYHEESEKAELDRYTGRIDYYMMLKQEGLI